ncbi:unnamed protein product [Rotaria magnacalcarata]|uniref:Uncharacterized protein n=2 Tax=Rotaria magnacalcarata TaxID=392030 RepID=A0A818XBC6_9BILA|nr:unnamed protein product [Rotaria magnacalcarata]CAF2245146.1 unnamed protein product [Rotaria magnacalcarata]CAF3738029.1 unnamed protein product [Rotaria magnacalcarata]
MMKHRFEVTSVDELNCDKIQCQSSEKIPLINITDEIPQLPSSVPSFTTINEINQPSPSLFNRFLEDVKKTVSLAILNQNLNPVSSPIVHYNSTTNGNLNSKVEEPDSNYSTIQSNVSDTNSLRLTNRFLYELRLKRRELREKTHDLSIEQRIALHRCQRNQNRLRAQDIFDVHFELDDNHDDRDSQFLNEGLQEKIRSNIFNELDRQSMKKYYKEYRQLIFGRTLLMLFTSLIVFMSTALVYVVIDLYDRAKYLDIKFPDNKFISMIYDQMAAD